MPDDIDDVKDIEAFLFHEARLLDEWRLEEWLGLFADELEYWIPATADDPDPLRQVSILYDDRQRLEERVERLHSGVAHSQEPRSRTQHLISNVAVTGSNGDGTTVSSALVIAEFRYGVQTIYIGRCTHGLVSASSQDGPQWQIAKKRIDLVNCDASLGNMTFLF